MTSPSELQQVPKPLVVAVDMGYGHLRAATPIAHALGIPVAQVDRPPLVQPEEARLWKRIRTSYELISRLSQIPVVGAPLRYALDQMTNIPHLHPYRDLSAPTRGVITLERLIRRNLGQGLLAHLHESGAPLVTTFYSPAIVADRAGYGRIFCVVTDTDINRIWAPVEPAATRIQYLVPTRRAARRLLSYGVPEARITFTGFPLPDALVGGPQLPVLKENLAARIVRLDPSGEFRRSIPEELAHFLGVLPEAEEGKPPLLTFAVGGAGAQAALAREFLPGFRRAVESGLVRIALVAGVRPEVDARFREAVHRAGLEPCLGRGVEILLEPSFEAYYERFNALLARTDVLWTKPSEMTFYAALGIPMVLAQPVGVHERYNRRWARESGAGYKQPRARYAAEWIADWLADGLLAAAAWAGYMRLPKFGLYRVLEAIGRAPDAPRALASASALPPPAPRPLPEGRPRA
jgi:hypothetical protein